MTARAIRSPGSVARIAGALRHFGRIIADSSGAARSAREAERLFRLSDAELARMGLTRDRVIHHAFARYLAC